MAYRRTTRTTSRRSTGRVSRAYSGRSTRSGSRRSTTRRSAGTPTIKLVVQTVPQMPTVQQQLDGPVKTTGKRKAAF